MLKGSTCFEMSFRLMSHSAEGRGALCSRHCTRNVCHAVRLVVESFLLFIAKIK